MLHSTFLLSLLASAVCALPTEPVLPSFAIVSPGATIIEPPSSVAPMVTATSTPVDSDQPDPYNSSIQIPASESFNPSNAPAFTPSSGVPNPTSNPAFPSTPCSTTVGPTSTPVDDDQPDPYNSSIQVPASESFNPSKAPAFTTIAGIPSPSAYPSTPCSNQATSTITTTVTAPAQTPAPSTGDDEPCDEEPTASSTSISAFFSAPPAPLSAFPSFSTGPALPASLSAFPSFSIGIAPPAPLSAFPSFSTIALPIGGPRPTGITFPSGRPAYGAGRPRPSGAWPSRGAARPTLGYGSRPRPSASSEIPTHSVAGKGAASTPCTLETRVRATPTAI
jgi:hypothetical protein